MAKTIVLLAGTADGVVQFSNPGAAGRWLRVGHALRGQSLPAVWFAADNPLVALVGGPAGLWRSSDGGIAWEQMSAMPVAALAGHGHEAPVYLADATGGISFSRDAGLTWEKSSTLEWPANNAARPVLTLRGSQLYAVLGRTLLIGTAPLETWEPYGGQPPAVVSAVTVAPEMSTNAYVIAEGIVYRSPALQQPWQPVTAPPTPAQAVTVLPGREETLLVGGAAGIWRSVDQGLTFTPGEAPSPWAAVMTLALSGYHLDTVFAGDAQGSLFISTSRGRTWELVRAGLPPILGISAARLA